MSPKKAGTDGMKQTKLDFSAGKRTASIAGLGKTKVGPTTPVATAALAATSAPAAPAGIAPVPTVSVESPTAARVTRAKAARQAKVEDVVADVKEGWEEEDKDEIEPAEDFTGSDSDTESLSSVTTYETVGTIEERVAPAPASPVAGRTTRSSVQNQMQTLNISKASVDSLVPAERTVKEEEVDEIESANDFDMEMGMDMFKPSNASEAELARRVEANDNIAKEEKGTLPELRVKAVKWRKYHDMLKKKYGNLPTSKCCFSRVATWT